ncbi:unnamed protein product [Chilo suppressalis]|uniref:Uncharacterized protein n=1 Tax=Chilo suppressalis TaxID=168631 RepID=A0ABN8BEK0_CHISP|nr:unnamed protein product [Chilo suppressalis]
MEVSLYNSTVCRLCGEENDHGTFLYSSEENNQDISVLINSYLPLKVSDDGHLPRTVCPGCTIQLEATVEFLNLIINGQKVIRQLYEREKEYKKNTFGNAGKEAQTFAETVIYEKTGDTVYPNDHPVSLQVGGIEKPKRKRGRPPKKNKPPEAVIREPATVQEEIYTIEEANGKRRRKTPTRFKEVIQGKELERIFIEEGVTDGEESDGGKKPPVKPEITPPTPKEPEVIGHMEKSGELVVVTKGKGRGRPKGRVTPRVSQCAICGAEFTCAGRYMAHVAQHGPVLYQCLVCLQSFPSRLLCDQHQAGAGHAGRRTHHPQDPPTSGVTLVQEEDPLASVSSIVNNVTMSQGLPDLNPIKEEPDKTTIVAKNEPDSSEPPIAASNGVNNEQENVVDEASDKDGKGKAKLKCHNCDKMFSSKQSRSLHNKAIHQGEKPYVCGECGAQFAYPRSLALHTHSHRRRTASKGYACDLCGKILNHPSSVVYHKEAEHAGQKYVCSKCGKSFKHKQLLQRHQLVHSQLRPYACKTCNATFKTKANLINHTLLHTGVKKFSCEICKQRFSHKTSLTLHMRWHTGQKPFSCNKCGKCFSQKGNLSEHERIHTGEKPYECNVCGRRFTTSSQHRLHARRHDAVRPYVCNTCGKRFTTRSSWSTHMRREAAAAAAAAAGAGGGGGEEVGAAPRPHACSECPRAFTWRWALRKHMRRHTGERPHRCPHCPKAFADHSNLNKHRKV